MYIYYNHIAGARQIFQKKNFCFIFIRKTSPGSEKKKVFMKNLPGDSNNKNYIEQSEKDRG
jgi:hypothetical protein